MPDRAPDSTDAPHTAKTQGASRTESEYRMNDTVSTDKPFAGFAPGEHRQLLADVNRWARTNGWHWHECWGWVNAEYADDATLGVDWDNNGITIRSGQVLLRPTTYPADSVREAVDLLVAIGVLPAHLSSAYKAGWHDGFFHTVEDETSAQIRASWSDRQDGAR